MLELKIHFKFLLLLWKSKVEFLKSVLKLDFHIYIHGDKDLIEKEGERRKKIL